MSFLEMSLAGGILILAVVVLRALLIHRLPKRAFLALWLVAVLRLLVPVAVPSGISVYSWAALENVTAEKHEQTGYADMTQEAPRPMAAEVEVILPGTARQHRAPVPAKTALWAVGALGSGGCFAAVWLCSRRRFKDAVSVEDEFVLRWLSGHPIRRRVSVRLSGAVNTPLTYGLFRPVILLPLSTDWQDRKSLEFILIHEYVHIKRLDGAAKLLLTLTACLHWFNPMVWVMYVLANRDLEMACDEQVVRALPGDGRAAYARTLIRMEQTKAGLAPLFSHFSKNAMEERITAIMKIKKLTAIAVIMSLMLVIGVTAVFATSTEREDVPAYAAYDWDGTRCLVPVTEDALEPLISGEDIEWWTYDEYAAWIEEQKVMLEERIGTPERSAAAGSFTWTRRAVNKTVAAYEKMLSAIGDGLMLSRSVSGDESVILAVNLKSGDIVSANGGGRITVYDLERLGYRQYDDEDWEPSVEHTVALQDGTEVSFQGSVTIAGLLFTMKSYFDNRVAAGAMTQTEEDDIFRAYLADYSDNIPLWQFVSGE